MLLRSTNYEKLDQIFPERAQQLAVRINVPAKCRMLFRQVMKYVVLIMYRLPRRVGSFHKWFLKIKNKPIAFELTLPMCFYSHSSNAPEPCAMDICAA